LINKITRISLVDYIYFTDNNDKYNFHIDNDLTKQKRKIQKKLKTIAKEEKREGKEAKMGYIKITIDWRWNEERGRLEVFQ
jgi:hypothetical protein